MFVFPGGVYMDKKNGTSRRFTVKRETLRYLSEVELDQARGAAVVVSECWQCGGQSGDSTEGGCPDNSPPTGDQS